jgi:sigma-B regulation protein RsbU (phosphoserine phosphatase)
MLKPARKTSGDFYDVHPLPDGRLGLAIADVVDKGVGAALYMVLSWSLLRQGVREFPGQPAQVLASVNRRLLHDTHAEEFVTVFYAVLDPVTGSLAYCNAGHNPPILFRGPQGQEIQRLVRTGVPLGILEEAAWEEGSAQMAPGDVLVLHTDGIVEAEDASDAFYGEQRLLGAVRAALDPAMERERVPRHLQDAILGDLERFVGDAPQLDDITLVVLARNG